MPAILFEHVTKKFRRARGGRLLRGHLARLVKRGATPPGAALLAVDDVSFSVEHSHSVALIGANGAGKTTVLSLVAGLAEPDAGRIRVEGRVAALMELGSGFHPELTGLENARLNGALLGLSRRRTEELLPRIVDFSGIGDAATQPIRTYSSGMLMRLAFSVAVNVEPDILLIDEVLAVGDEAFRERCFDKLHQFRREGRTMLCVSHDPALLAAVCDDAIWINRGRLRMRGPLREVHDAYEREKAAQPA
jgi:ABC-type polysaccharide/polyol phosphate transport system ATPase subunit